MQSAAAWSTQQLAEFLALVSSFESEAAAALGAVERVAEALDAEVAAIVSGGKLIAAVGYREDSVPVDELAAVASGATRDLMVPGVGVCQAAVAPLEHPQDATIILARGGADPLSREEMSVLRGMARVASMTMRMLSLLGEERAAREESQLRAAENARLLTALTERQSLLEWLLNEQAALQRVATLVARAVDQDVVFTAVAVEVAGLASADVVQIYRYEASSAVRVAVWGAREAFVEVGSRLPIGGHNVLTLVHETGRPARIDDAAAITGGPASLTQSLGVRSAIGSPIVVDGHLWGVVIASATRPERMPPESERRISGFTELVATAISNAQARAELAASRARVIAASDETRRRIERDLHDGIQQRLVTLALGLRGVTDAGSVQLPELQAQLAHVGHALQDLLEEVREISRGVHPAILSEAGLAPALKSLGRRSTVPVELDIRLAGGLPRSVEVAAYYLVSEALTNTAKHANASVARVKIEADSALLHIEVSDDGVGGADPARGSGLVGLTDRVAALGGTIAITSPRGAGTTMIAELPADRA